MKTMNELYKTTADMHRRQQVYQEREMVMAHLRKERYPQGAYNKAETQENWSL